MLKNLLLVGLGGGMGSALRYMTTVVVSRFFQSHVPLATFAVNVLGCFLIGVLIGCMDRESELFSGYKLLLITGFCGGFTTFSTFAHENLGLLQSGHWLVFALYVALSVFFGIVAVWFGLTLTR